MIALVRNIIVMSSLRAIRLAMMMMVIEMMMMTITTRGR